MSGKIRDNPKGGKTLTVRRTCGHVEEIWTLSREPEDYLKELEAKSCLSCRDFLGTIHGKNPLRGA